MNAPLPHPSSKAAYVRAMFARIAGRYDLLNTLMTAGLDARWRAEVAARVATPSDRVALDVGTGTARLALELARRMPDGLVVGVDFTEPMLRRGMEQLRDDPAGRRVRLVLGDAVALPLGDRTVDCAATAFTVRNLADVVGGFREIARVLRPGGRLACLEIVRPRSRLGLLFDLYFARIVPLVGRWVSGDPHAYTYLPASAYAFLDAPSLAGAMRAAGLVDVRYRLLGLGSVAMHLGRRPTDRSDREQALAEDREVLKRAT